MSFLPTTRRIISLSPFSLLRSISSTSSATPPTSIPIYTLATEDPDSPPELPTPSTSSGGGTLLRPTLAYFIPRLKSPTGDLPVYSDIRNGGSTYLTIIRKVEGDLNVCIPCCSVASCCLTLEWFALPQALSKDLSDALQLPSVVKQGARQVVFRGDVRLPVKMWLEDRGF